MLYLDSSALVKVYVNEPGSERLGVRMEQGDRIFTSELTFAEIHSTFARKRRNNEINSRKFHVLLRNFLNDWAFKFVRLEVNANTMTAIPALVKEYPLKGADAVHLSSAIWLRDAAGDGSSLGGGDSVIEFGAADKRLIGVAARCGLGVFDPEAVS